MSNLGFAGMDPRTEFAYTREQYDRIVRSEAIPGVAAVAGNTEIMERRAAVAGDPDACFKMLKSMQPHGLAKAEPVVIAKPEPLHKVEGATEAITGPTDVTALIRKAHGEPLTIQSLEAGYQGREQIALAKAAAVENEKINASDLDRVPPALRAAIQDFDEMALRLDSLKQRQINRRPGAARF